MTSTVICEKHGQPISHFSTTDKGLKCKQCNIVDMNIEKCDTQQLHAHANKLSERLKDVNSAQVLY